MHYCTNSGCSDTGDNHNFFQGDSENTKFEQSDSVTAKIIKADESKE